MCVIIAATEKQVPSDILDRCAKANPHGIGVAWRENGITKWKKGVVLPELNIMVSTLPLPYIVHFRWASVGGVTDNLLHPFIINGDSPLKKEGENETLLFHNGHYDDYRVLQDLFKLKLEDVISDSRVLASIVSKYGYNILDSLGKKRNRFVVFSNKKIRFFGEDWKKYKGCLFSNLNWLQEKKTRFHEQSGFHGANQQWTRTDQENAEREYAGVMAHNFCE